MSAEIDNVCNLLIIIVNYKTGRLVTDCLNSVISEALELKARIVVVDNASNDDSVKTIRKWINNNNCLEFVSVVESDKNLGFAAGNNIGIRQVKANNYLLLNSDTILSDGVIKYLLDTSRLFSNAGIVSPRLVWPDGAGQESCFNFHSPFSEMIEAAQTRFIERFFLQYKVSLPVQNKIMFPEWTSFACVLIKNEVFDAVGLLDEGFFMYFEDVEFCYRAQKAGWKVLHNPAAQVIHLRGGSSPVKERARSRKRIPRYYYESRTRFFYITYGWFGLILTNLLWWLGRLISKIRQLLGRKDKSAIEDQWLDIWTNCLHPAKPYSRPKSNIS